MPYEETEPKQLMVENNCNNNTADSEVPNIVNTNNDKDEQTRGTAGRRSPALIQKWNNVTVRYAGLIPPRPHHLN
jgi:hypothetical protein